ncbi:MAG TPA: phosphoribosylanthranilate isomerase [Armatimonadota bacterium]|jgi:phosphoribosylanthranilate isomerase
MDHPIHVKICGITGAEDARAAAEAGADALGLVFAPSPRQVDLRQIPIVAEAAPGVELVGVFVAEPLESIKAAVSAGVRGVQLHRRPETIWSERDVSEFHELAAEYRLRLIAAVSAESSDALRADLPSRLDGAHQCLLDAFVTGQEGGTGKAFDWGLVEIAKSFGKPVIVAGGLTPDNVATCIRQAKPWGVDVCSGVEQRPGVKDHAEIRRFLQAAHSAAEDTWVW